MYQLSYHPQAVKNLKHLHPNDRKKLIKKLESLSKNPRDSFFNIKKLVNTTNSFRLRVGNVRAIYEIDEITKIIYVWDIDYRGSIY